MKNIAEILKNCPKGTKLYSVLLGDCSFEEIEHCRIYVRDSREALYSFDLHGRWTDRGECLLFPSKDDRDWDKFMSFKDGDIIVSAQGDVAIYKGISNYFEDKHADFYVGISKIGLFIIKNSEEQNWGEINNLLLATEKEKQKLFDAIKANGYKWNAETKTLEKLIVPKFKVGDTIRNKKTGLTQKIVNIDDISYGVCIGRLDISKQDNYELIPNKFDISTLKPFDKVLVRDYNGHHWRCALYERYDNTRDIMYFATIIGHYQQCIPFEGNEHLLGTTNGCDDYYKNW